MIEAFANAIDSETLCATGTAWGAQYMEIRDSSTPGPFDPDENPPLNRFIDVCSPAHPCTRVVLVKGNQIGGTVAAFAVVGFRLHQHPGPVLWVIPKVEDVRGFVARRVYSFLDATSILRSRVGERSVQERKSKLTKGSVSMGLITFPSASLRICGSSPPSTFDESPASLVVFDDYSRFEKNLSKEEGDHAILADRRLNTYSRVGGKLVVISTPTTAPDKTWAQLKESSWCEYWVPCPRCGADQVLRHKGLRWDKGRPSTAHFVCVHCAAQIFEGDKRAMLLAGSWRARQPQYTGRCEGFHLPAYYARSMSRTWASIAQAYDSAVDRLRALNEHDALQVCVNLDRALPWNPPSLVKLAEHEAAVYDRREPDVVIERESTARGLITTAGTDRQHDRLETHAIRWGRGLEGWSRLYKVHRGDTSQPAVWNEWVEWVIAHGIRSVCVDGSDQTSATCKEITALLPIFAAAGVLVWVIKGDEGSGRIWPGAVPSGNVDAKSRLAKTVTVKVDELKTWVYGSLFNVRIPGPGFLHFGRARDQPWFRQLFGCRERGSTDPKGRSKYVDVAGRRQEVIDATDYALAAVHASAAIGDPAALQVLGVISAAPPPPRPPPPVRPKNRERKRRFGKAIL